MAAEATAIPLMRPASLIDITHRVQRDLALRGCLLITFHRNPLADQGEQLSNPSLTDYD